MLWKIIRRLLALFIRVFIWHPVVSLVLVAVGLGVAGFALGGPSALTTLMQGQQTSVTGVGTTVGTTAPSVAVQSAAAVSPPPSVDEYIRGMMNFDAGLMWDALDPRAVQTMQSQGNSQQTLQQRLDQAKQTGARYDGVTFVGGYTLDNGDRYMFYVMSRKGFAGPGVADQIFFVFTVGQSGKIVKIE